MKIYTKTGDAGETGLIGNQRVSKASLQIDAIGNVDELNSCLGVIRSFELSQNWNRDLGLIQNDLFNLGAALAKSSSTNRDLPSVNDSNVEELESWIDELTQQLPPIKQFILPGGSRAGAMAHLARSICRRAERSVVALAAEVSFSLETELIYLNRLSDLLFVVARRFNLDSNETEVFWEQDPR